MSGTTANNSTAETGVDIGSKLMVQVTMDTENGWYMTELHIQAGFEPIPVTKKGAAIPGHSNCKMEFSELEDACRRTPASSISMRTSTSAGEPAAIA